MAELSIAVLTTDTPHHRYFLRELNRRKPPGVSIGLVLFETQGLPARRLAARHFRNSLPNLWKGLALNPYLFMGLHASAIHRYETEHFFPDGDQSLPDDLQVITVQSVNHDIAREKLSTAQPDIAFVYGTGLIKRDVFSIPRLDTVNAHGGLLPSYRGLDTNLWAAFEGRPEDMAVTLHRMDDDFDTGPIYLERRLGPKQDLSLVSLRYHTTILTTGMYLDLATAFAAKHCEPKAATGRPSRYFRPMPAILKRRADRALRTYASSSVVH